MNTQPPVIAKFSFVRALGAGGASTVYLYRQGMPERDVAIKVLKSEVVNSNLVSAFEAEANLMARVSNHPAIASIFEANITADGRPYLVMEYCPPPSLGQRYRTERVSIAEALRIGIQICGAVETAHRAGIIHRDIKPANILFTEYHRPVLTDFGIATAHTGTPTQGNQGLSVPWAPPEIINNTTNDNDTRTDIYSLGATVYALIAGRSPFETPGMRTSEAELVGRILHQNAPPTGRPDAPDTLEHILAKALEKDPGARYSSAVELGWALQLVQTQLHLERTPIDIVNTNASDGSVSPGESQAPVDYTMTSAISSIRPPGTPPPGQYGAAPHVAPNTKKGKGRGLAIGASIAGVVLVAGIGVAALALRDSDPDPDPNPSVAQSPTEPQTVELVKMKPGDFDSKVRGATPTPGFYQGETLDKALSDLSAASGLSTVTWVDISEKKISIDFTRSEDSSKLMSCTISAGKKAVCNKSLLKPRGDAGADFSLDSVDAELASTLASNSRELSGLGSGEILRITIYNGATSGAKLSISVEQDSPSEYVTLSMSLTGKNLEVK